MDDLEIDRTLRATLCEDPSPDFVARVRTTLAEAPRPSLFAGMWKPVTAVACVAVVSVAIVMRQDARLKPSPTRLAPVTAGLKASTTMSSRTTGPRAPSVVVPTSSAAVASAKAGRSAKPTKPANPARAVRSEPPFPEVIVAAEDVEALRQLLVSLHEHTFVATFDETPAPTPWVMTNLSVAPLDGEALNSTPVHNN